MNENEIQKILDKAQGKLDLALFSLRVLQAGLEENSGQNSCDDPILVAGFLDTIDRKIDWVNVELLDAGFCYQKTAPQDAATS